MILYFKAFNINHLYIQDNPSEYVTGFLIKKHKTPMLLFLASTCRPQDKKLEAADVTRLRLL